jgi:transcription elongation GreA/GreB family factor
MTATDKNQIIQAIVAHLDRELAALTESQRATQSGATHEETRQEDAKDTRAIEASYLARGLAERVSKLRDARNAIAAMPRTKLPPDTPITVGALISVELEPDATTANYYLVPLGGGIAIEIDNETIQTITPTSPLGQALLGAQSEDTLDYTTPQGTKELTITATH